MKHKFIVIGFIVIFAIVLVSQAGDSLARSNQSSRMGMVITEKAAAVQQRLQVFAANSSQPDARSSMMGVTAVSTCTDSDGGLNYEIAGFVEGTGPNGWSYTKSDRCESGDREGQLREFYCNGTIPWPKFNQCSNGCADGACLSEPIVCTDSDSDMFAVGGGVCGQLDCDDTNPAVNPGATEVCDNEIDDNCNGLVDAADPICSDTPPPNIIVVGWDGVQRDHLWQCYNQELPECENGLPNLQALSGGNILDITITSGDTATKPGWAQIFSGYNAEVMGIYSNGEYQPLPEGYSVFEKLENHFGSNNIVTMFLSGKGVNTGGACVGDPTTEQGQPVVEDQGQPWCLAKDHLDYYENDLRQNTVVGNRALELLETHQNDLFFALFLFRVPDVIGHLAGENTVDYSNAIIDDDLWLGIIMDKLQELGIDDRTLVYVTTDHGFDEDGDQHGNAPFTFLATNDPLVVREGDRKDVAPTFLERYGIGLGPVGGAPAVDGYSLYSLPPLICVPEGEAYLDYPGAPLCCDGLSAINLDKVYGLTEVPATGGTGDNSGYCTACGDGVCTDPENSANCTLDCS